MKLTWADVYKRVEEMGAEWELEPGCKVWGIPRGGSIVAGIAHLKLGVEIVDSPESASIAMDDIIDSGATADALQAKYGLETAALVNKDAEEIETWVHFPWEEPPRQDIGESVRRIIEYLGDDPRRNGLLETPGRVVGSWDTLFSGYAISPASYLRWFDCATDEMVICKNIQFYSTCEHHMLPFFGTASIGYIPNGKVVGISKLSRVVNGWARRLMIQEGLTQAIGRTLEPYVQGVAVHLEAQHLCMMARGVQQQDSTMVTNYLSGAFREQPETRAEFLQAVTNS